MRRREKREMEGKGEGIFSKVTKVCLWIERGQTWPMDKCLLIKGKPMIG